MGATSTIEWTDASWTPIRARNLVTGKIGWHCEHATTGCEFCYAESMNKRLGTGLPFKPGHRKDIEIFLDEEMLLLPLRWKKPRRVFVCSMTDAFAEFVKDEWIDKLFAVMALCPQHTFQVLTKRAERMREYLSHRDVNHRLQSATYCFGPTVSGQPIEWPLPNVWIGTSVERQEEADERIPLLLQTPAAVRFISAEPLLGAINLKRIKVADLGWQDVLEGWRECKDYPGRESILDWVIVGGESGPHARPMHPDWARSLRDQCKAAGVPFFLKQWGEHALTDRGESGAFWFDGDGKQFPYVAHDPPLRESKSPAFALMRRVGKKAAGRLLDGREHNEFPAGMTSSPQHDSSVTDGRTSTKPLS